MTEQQKSPGKNGLSFGPFTLCANERLLQCDGAPVQLGARALDILIVLTEHASEVVNKKELMARVWPDVTVDEGSLRFHIAALRKALGDGRSGARYVTTVPGRGYCFVAPLAKAGPSGASAEPPLLADSEKLPLPVRLKRMVGRDSVVAVVSEQLTSKRFVTIAGPGGIGKTTVAVTVAHNLRQHFHGEVHFFDLGPLSDAGLVPNAIASALGLIVQSNDPIPSLVTFLREKHVLLVLDSCEHVIDIAAALAERICVEAPETYILATSREDLRVEGEHVHRLAPLDYPPELPGLKAAQALSYPAVQLFVDRVAASGHALELNDANAAIVGEICRKLDGMPLALELAASRVEAYGLNETASLLDSFRLRWRGRRTAVLRHQTLSATLDWSYELLSETERVVLRRLAVFVGTFPLEACITVVPSPHCDTADIVAALASLIKKSLVVADTGKLGTRYRLLDTTRSYALGKLIESGEEDETARRHALYYRAFIEQLDSGRRSNSRTENHALYGEHLGNVRSALEWSFCKSRNPALAVALAASAVRLLLGMSLLTECHRWAEQAIAALDETTRGTREEMELQGALGLTGMFTRGNGEDVRSAFMRSLELSKELKQPANELSVLGRLHIFQERIGDYHTSLAFARSAEAVAVGMGEPAAMAAAHSLLGIAQHLIGDQCLAQRHLELALSLPPGSARIAMDHFGFNHRNRAQIALARTLWLQGYVDQSEALARRTVEEAEALDYPVTLCIALIWAVSVFLWSGDLDTAEDYIEQFIEHAGRHSLAPYNAVGRGVKGELLVKRGRAQEGMRLLSEALSTLHKARYELLTTAFHGTLAQGLMRSGRTEEALATTEETIAQVERGGDLFYLPELLRIKGEILSSGAQSDWLRAEVCFQRSIELARRQCAMGWELRSAIHLALMKSRQKRTDEAYYTLARVYDRFTEGFGSADIKVAGELLDDFRSAISTT